MRVSWAWSSVSAVLEPSGQEQVHLEIQAKLGDLEIQAKLGDLEIQAKLRDLEI